MRFFEAVKLIADARVSRSLIGHIDTSILHNRFDYFQAENLTCAMPVHVKTHIASRSRKRKQERKQETKTMALVKQKVLVDCLAQPTEQHAKFITVLVQNVGMTKFH